MGRRRVGQRQCMLCAKDGLSGMKCGDSELQIYLACVWRWSFATTRKTPRSQGSISRQSAPGIIDHSATILRHNDPCFFFVQSRRSNSTRRVQLRALRTHKVDERFPLWD